MCLEGEQVHLEHANIEGFFYHEACVQANWTHGDTQNALLGMI